jgi:glycosyltransferase involved in cell wall biosynthesis
MRVEDFARAARQALSSPGAAALVPQVMSTGAMRLPLDGASGIAMLRIAAALRSSVPAGARARVPAGVRDAVAARGVGPPGAVNAARAMALALDLLGPDTADAARRLLDQAAAGRLAAEEDAAELRLAMARCGLDLPLGIEADAGLLPLLVRVAGVPGLVSPALHALGLSAHAGPPVREAVFEALASPLADALAEAGDLDALVELEQVVRQGYVNPSDVPATHSRAYGLLDRTAGAVARAMSSPRPVPRPRRPGAAPRVAFLLHNRARLAHADVLVAFLRGLAGAPRKPIEPVVVVHSDRSVGMDAGFEALGVPTHVLPLGFPDFAGGLGRLRAGLAELGVDAVVHVSVPTYLAAMSAFRVAPVHIWWSMKYPLPVFPDMDGLLFNRMLVPGRREIDGRTWRGGPLGMDLPDPVDPARVADLRRRLGGGLILGTVAREEKISEPAYLDAVAAILRARPDARFVWTGRSPLPAVADAFAAAGVADRCVFAGWVDPFLYAASYDLFLETFPLTGLTSAWAMSFGVPVVSAGPMSWYGCHLEGMDEAADGPQAAAFADAFGAVAGRVPCIWGRDGEEFVALALALADDPELRAAFGEAGRRFVRGRLSDTTAFALSMADHIADIVAEAAAGTAPGDGG